MGVSSMCGPRLGVGVTFTLLYDDESDEYRLVSVPVTDGLDMEGYAKARLSIPETHDFSHDYTTEEGHICRVYTRVNSTGQSLS